MWKFIAKASPGGSNQANLTSIPQTYKDLAVIFTVRGGASSTKEVLQCVANPGNMPGTVRFLSIGNVDNGISAQPAQTSQGTQFAVGYVAGNTMTTGRNGSGMMYFPNYTSNNSGNTVSYTTVSRIATDRALNNVCNFTTSGLGFAITSLRFYTTGNTTFQGDTVFYLYGIS